MRALAWECERRWGRSNEIAYAKGMLYLSQSLSTYGFNDEAQDGLSQKYAVHVLRTVANIPMDLRLKLLDQARGWRSKTGEKVVGGEWAALRKEQARLWLGAMRDLKAGMDPAWDPKQITGMHNLPPSVAGRVTFGQDAASIDDPQLRAEYTAAVEKNRADIARYNEQYWLRKYRARYLPEMEKYLTIAYDRPPIDLEQLQNLLKQYDLEPPIQERILAAVQAAVASRERR